MHTREQMKVHGGHAIDELASMTAACLELSETFYSGTTDADIEEKILLQENLRLLAGALHAGRNKHGDMRGMRKNIAKLCPRAFSFMVQFAKRIGRGPWKVYCRKNPGAIAWNTIKKYFHQVNGTWSSGIQYDLIRLFFYQLKERGLRLRDVLLVSKTDGMQLAAGAAIELKPGCGKAGDVWGLSQLPVFPLEFITRNHEEALKEAKEATNPDVNTASRANMRKIAATTKPHIAKNLNVVVVEAVNNRGLSCKAYVSCDRDMISSEVGEMFNKVSNVFACFDEDALTTGISCDGAPINRSIYMRDYVGQPGSSKPHPASGTDQYYVGEYPHTVKKIVHGLESRYITLHLPGADGQLTRKQRCSLSQLETAWRKLCPIDTVCKHPGLGMKHFHRDNFSRQNCAMNFKVLGAYVVRVILDYRRQYEENHDADFADWADFDAYLMLATKFSEVSDILNTYAPLSIAHVA